MNSHPTAETYHGLSDAYDHFNNQLFDGTLPRCLITLQRRPKTYGYFSGDRWQGTQPATLPLTDEIALNPAHFATRDTTAVLSTLVHEMCHLWQHRFGKPSEAFHNREWAARMEAVGLIPSHTGQPGGKKTGKRVSHYVAPGGPFAVACESLLASGFTIPYVDRLDDTRTVLLREQKRRSKSRYTCPDCGLHAWGKPGLQLVCGPCRTVLI